MASIKDKKTVWRGKHLKAVEISFRNKEGDLDSWEAVERIKDQEIVSIVAITKDHGLLFVQQFRPPIAKEVIEFPAGLCEPNEEPAQAAGRELEEETGYRASEISKLFFGPVSSGLSSEVLTVFFAQDLKFVGKKCGKEERGITVYKVPLKKTEKWLKEQEKKGTPIDVKVLPLISYLKEIKRRGK